MSTPSSLVRYQELYTAITAGQEEIGSILVYKTFQYSFLKGSLVYSRSHGAFEKKYDSIFFMRTRNPETIGSATIFVPDSERSV